MSAPTPSRKDLPVHPNGRHVVGIDIGKKTHAAAALTRDGRDFGRTLSLTNDRAGIDRLEEQLLKPLGGPKAVLLGLEATGHYWMPLYFELRRRGYQSVVINPIQTNSRFRSRIRKTKTDPLDARAIARFLLSGEARTARIPDESVLALRLRTRHRWRLTDLAADLERFAHSLVDRLFPEFQDMFCSPFNATGRALLRQLGLAPQTLAANPTEVATVVRQAGRGRVPSTATVELLRRAGQSIGIRRAEDVLVAQLRSTIELLELLEKQREALDAELAQLVELLHSPLTSLGLGAPLVATIHAESDPISDFRHPWQFAAFTGLDPSHFESGQMNGTRTPISKRGSPYLRRALYLAAFSLYRRHKSLQRLYQKQRKAGHLHNDALVIVAHKLARIIWRLLTDQRDFRSNPPRQLPSQNQPKPQK
jgi:transposase